MQSMNMNSMYADQPEMQDITQQRRFAEMLRQQAMQDQQGQMVSGHYVAPSVTQGLARLLKAYVARKTDEGARDQESAFRDRMNTELANTFGRYVQTAKGTPESAQGQYYPAGGNPDEQGGMGFAPAQAPDPQRAIVELMQSRHPLAQQIGAQQMLAQAQPQKPVTVGRSLIDPATGKVVGVDQTWQAEQGAARQAAAEKAAEDRQARIDMARDQANLRRELAGQASADRMAIAGMVNARGEQPKVPVGYRLLPDGNLQAIPGGPADAKAQADAQRKADGATDVDVALGTLRDAYARLSEGGGITSTKNGPLTNAGASISSSGIGQMAGKLFGTQNQSARNDIAMARPALLAALLRATGMSAKQMDSNAELKLWLSTATDPTLDVEANRKALDNIERKYLHRGEPSAAAGGGNLSPAEQKELDDLRKRFKK